MSVMSETSPAPALFATCWTVAGNVAPNWIDKRSPLSFQERVEAAAAAGFTGIGLIHEDLAVARDAYGWKGIRTILDDNGMVEFEVEGLVDWWADAGAERALSDAARRLMLQAAEEVGVRHLKVLPDTSGEPWRIGRWAAEYNALAQQCATAGTRVALEFLPWANIATISDGLALCAAADHPGAGLLIDIWHTERGGTPAAELANVPIERIFGIELNDAAAEQVGTFYEDTVDRRRYCGAGDFDVTGFIQALAGAGWAGSWGVEILSVEHREQPIGPACRRTAETTLAALQRALPTA